MTVATGGNDPMVDLAATWAKFELGARREDLLKPIGGPLPHVKSSAKPDSLPHLKPPDGKVG
jgi:hypothetical protein